MHLTFFNNRKELSKASNIQESVTTNQYQHKMKNESSQRLIHFNKFLFCWKYTIINETNPHKIF